MATLKPESPYPRKLADPRFLKLCEEILIRDGSRCLSCQTIVNLQVRHVVHRGLNPWEYPTDLYHVICRKCADERAAMLDSLFDAVRVHFKRTTNYDLRQWIEAFLERLSGDGEPPK